MHEGEGHLIFTDGSSLGNPGPGGWGTILVLDRERVIEMGGRESHTTNNRMELTALIEGLLRINDESGDIHIYTDSSYVMNGATKWSHGWRARDWKTTTKTDVENRDLWEQLFSLLENRKKFGHVGWNLIRGHVGIDGNERCDAIATGFAGGDEVELFEGDLGDYAVDILHIAVDDEKLLARKNAKSRSRAKAYSYVSCVNGKVLRHATWAECESRVKGKAAAKFKKVFSLDEERALMLFWSK
jgi:ribonuclease HI